MVSPILVTILLLLILLIIGVPIGSALGLTAVVSIIYFEYGMGIVAPNIYASISKFSLLAIPLYITAGVTLAESGIAEVLVNVAKKVFKGVYGGLPIAVIGVGTFWGAVSGSGPGTTAAIGVVLIPALIENGYSKAFSAGVVSTVASLSIVVPPSIALIIYGNMTATSVGALFLGGLIPGMMIGGFFMIVAYFLSRKRGQKVESKEVMEFDRESIRDSILGLMTPVIILGGIYGGVFTPTEAAVVAVVYSWFVGTVVLRTITLDKFMEILADSARMSSIVMFVVAFAMLFSWVGQTQGLIPKAVGLVTGLTQTPWMVLVLLSIVLVIAGMFIDPVSIYAIFVPIFMPLMNRFGWDFLWFGIFMTVLMSIGQVTPPVAVNVYVGANIADASMENIAKEEIFFIAALLLGVLLLILFPELATWLPRQAGFH